MREIKIFVFPSHLKKDRTGGVDFVRLLQPMQYLDGFEYEDVKFKIVSFDMSKKTKWDWVAKNVDVIYFNYINDPWGFAAMGAMARHFGVKLVMDLDDSLWNIKSDNPAHAVYHKGSEAIKNFNAICKEVDYMTCTNDYLKNIIIHQTEKEADKIRIFPNYIDLDLWKYRCTFKDDGRINLFHFGSTTHFIDLQDRQFLQGMDKIMKEYPNVFFKTTGAFMPKLKEMWGARYESQFGAEDIYNWAKKRFPELIQQADILVVPLPEDIYNRAKSPIKWLESSSAKIPGVWSNIRQYREVITGKNGILAKTDKEWYRAIKSLIEDKELRRKMGEQAFEDVKANWQMQDHKEEYARFFKEIVDAKRR